MTQERPRGRSPLTARLRRDSRGMALTEFALSLPVLLVLGLGGLEVARYVLATERISQMAMLVADNAGRVRDSIDEIDVNEVMTGAALVGEPIDFAENGRIILSSLEQNSAKNGQWIRWQRCSGANMTASSYGPEGTGKNNSTLQGFGPVGNRIAAASGTAVMAVEVFYDYRPIVPMPLVGLRHRQIHFEAAFNVRQRNDQVLKNSKSLPKAKTSSCTQ